MKRCRGLLLALIVLLGIAGKGLAQEKKEEDPLISFGIRAGYYKPSLRTLNRVIANPSLSILQDPNFLLPRNPEFLADCSIIVGFPCTPRSISTPAIGGNALYGADIGYRINSQFSLVLTLEFYSSKSIATDTAHLLIRQDQPFLDPAREARYNLDIAEYILSWRYHLYNEPRRKTLYFDLGFFGLAQADLTMDALMKVLPEKGVTLPNGGFTSVSSTEATGLGFVIRFGIGGEYFLTRWLSIGMNAEYLIGKIPKLEVRRAFTAGFPETPNQPPEALLLTPVALPTPQPPPNVGDYVVYGPVGNTSAVREVSLGPGSRLPIELDGFDITGQVRIHF
jgi:hypothetical protein